MTNVIEHCLQANIEASGFFAPLGMLSLDERGLFKADASKTTKTARRSGRQNDACQKDPGTEIE